MTFCIHDLKIRFVTKTVDLAPRWNVKDEEGRFGTASAGMWCEMQNEAGRRNRLTTPKGVDNSSNLES